MLQVALVLVLAALWAGGALRLHLASQETVSGVVLRIGGEVLAYVW